MTMPYWAERLRVRMIHELGGYTAIGNYAPPKRLARITICADGHG